MSRVTGTFSTASNYEVTVRRPFDARMLVPTYADLMLESNWLVDSKSIAYNGMIVAVGRNTDDVSKNGVYYLYDKENTSALSKPNVTNEANWHKVCDAEFATDDEVVALFADK